MILGRVILAPPERRELKRRARSRSLAVESVRRAKVILMLAAGESYGEICERLGCSDRYVSLWKERFQQERLSGSDSRYRGAKHRRRTGEIEARILEVTRRGPHRRIDPLEQLSAGQGGGGQPVNGQSSVAAIWAPTAPDAQLYGQ
jgi:hypothetical protein